MFRAPTLRILLATLALLSPLAGCKNTVRELLKSPEKSRIDQDAFEAHLHADAPRLDGPQTPALIFAQGLDGYIEPCGCTEDVRYGGIDRLVGTVHALRDAHDAPILYAHGGDTLFESGKDAEQPNAQDIARLKLLQQSLNAADLRVMGVGPNDLMFGLDVFEEFASKLPSTLVSTNVQPHAKDSDLGVSAHVETLQGTSVVFLNVIHPSALEGGKAEKQLDIQEIDVALHEALQQVDVAQADLRIVFAHGDRSALRHAFTRSAYDLNALDFILIRSEDDPQDGIQHWAGIPVLSTWSHGRNVGALRFSLPKDRSAEDAQPSNAAPDDAPSARETKWHNARVLSRVEQEEYKELIAQVGEQIDTLDAQHTGDEAPPMRQTLVDRQSGYETRLKAAEAADPPAFEGGGAAYLWDVFRLDPELPAHDETQNARVAYNQELQAINLRDDEPPPKPKDGEAGYIGAAACQNCHQEAYDMWENTAHADAYNTLSQRDKAYDLECISCHVTGYAQPGGSSLVHIDGFQDVQCESCHGPGSLHAKAPTAEDGSPHSMVRDVPESTCLSCHTPEHSTRFDHARYRTRIIGPGHGAPAANTP